MTTTRTVITLGDVTKSQLAELSIGKLVEIHNKMAEKPVKAFHTKTKAVDRIWDLAKSEEPKAAPKAAPAAKEDRKAAIAANAAARAQLKADAKAAKLAAKAEKKAAKAEGKRGRARLVVDLPGKAADELKPPRHGTAVEVAMTLWGRPGGATDEEVCTATGKSRGHIRGILRWCNRGLGYGFKQEGDKIFLVDAKGRAATFTATAKA